jgi:hypothetical protein
VPRCFCHRWRRCTRHRVGPGLRTLMELRTFSALPLPGFHAVQGQDITLSQA